MPVTGFAMDVATSEDGEITIALLTLETGELTFEFAINEDGAKAMIEEFAAVRRTRATEWRQTPLINRILLTRVSLPGSADEWA
ncbi:hypothetical protein [Mesorhizobium sp.]|uniref:hypothetical protein n=1 Tax=Mesorhizobium sp. TaxID=1871066 RepID=UPI0025C5E158|nr:hypothetical protein [Mesorhizobium sp.]